MQARPLPADGALDVDEAADDSNDEMVTAEQDTVVDEPAVEPVVAATPTVTRAAVGQPGRRRIERLSQAAPAPTRAGRTGRGPANAAAMFQPLESEDAAIPFDRVPYVPADLRRVLVMALLMVVLIIIAAVIVTHVVH